MKNIKSLTIMLSVLAFSITSCKKDSDKSSGFTQDFNDVSSLISQGWAIKDNGSPLGESWIQGTNAFIGAQSGSAKSYIETTENVPVSGSSSCWLITPVIKFRNGDKIVFYTVANTGASYYNQERLQVRRNTANTGTNVGNSLTEVGDFKTLLYDLNPTEAQNGYPMTWTKVELTITDLSGPTDGRLAFRYYLGLNGYHTDGVAIDSLAYVPGN